MNDSQKKLKPLRLEIDAVDQALIKLIAQRFSIVDRVIKIKRNSSLPASIPERVEQVVQNAIQRAKESNIPEMTVEKIWRLLIAETIAYEESELTPK